DALKFQFTRLRFERFEQQPGDPPAAHFRRDPHLHDLAGLIVENMQRTAADRTALVADDQEAGRFRRLGVSAFVRAETAIEPRIELAVIRLDAMQRIFAVRRLRRYRDLRACHWLLRFLSDHLTTGCRLRLRPASP